MTNSLLETEETWEKQLQRNGREDPVKMKAEVGGMQLQAKDCQGLPFASEARREA